MSNRIALTSGAYNSRALINNCQQCINLYPEDAPAETEAASPVTHMPTPGLALQLDLGTGVGVRGLFTSKTNGDLYAVSGNICYWIESSWQANPIGYIGLGNNPVSFVDNGSSILLVDGTANGYGINIDTHNMFGINASNASGINGYGFVGADRVDYADGFIVGNTPGTANFFASVNNQLAFDALSYAQKSGGIDPVKGVAILNRYLWVIGSLTSEIWNNVGAQPFPYSIVEGPFINYGTTSVYSIAVGTESIFWLSQNKDGFGEVIEAKGYKATVISTYPISREIRTYSKIDDAIGFCYQTNGHLMYVLTFPTADKTWVYDTGTTQWHEWNWSDANGKLHRHRANCFATAYGKQLVGDWETGKIYYLDDSLYTDAGAPIQRVRSFPHGPTTLNSYGQPIPDEKRLKFAALTADIQVGQVGADVATGTYPISGPVINLSWSDDRGQTFSNPIMQTLGPSGNYLRSVKWNRLGIARDRVYRLSWSANCLVALQGAFVQPPVAGKS